MPKHFHEEDYLGNPYSLFPKANIHPDIEHHPKEGESDQTHYLLPAVFVVEKGISVTFRYPGNGVYYFTEGEVQYEDVKHPGVINKIGAGAVLHIEEGTVLNWSTFTQVKGFATFHVPVSVKSYDEFVVQETVKS